MAIYPYNGILNDNEEKDLFKGYKWGNDSFICLFKKWLSEIYFTYYKIHLFQMYNSMIISNFIEW